MTDVAYFEREEKYVCAVLYNGKKYITDFLNLSEVEAIVNNIDRPFEFTTFEFIYISDIRKHDRCACLSCK